MAPPVASTALNTALFPQYVIEDGRWIVSGYDLNGLLVAWPFINNSPAYAAQASVASATQVFTDLNQSAPAATASYNLLSVCIDEITWFFPPRKAVNVPTFITQVATQAGWAIS